MNAYGKKHHFAMKKQDTPQLSAHVAKGSLGIERECHVRRLSFPLKNLSCKTETSVAYFFSWFNRPECKLWIYKSVLLIKFEAYLERRWRHLVSSQILMLKICI